MKSLLVGLFIFILAQSAISKTIDLRKRRIPGIKLNYTNTVLLEQTARINTNGPADTERIQVTMTCYKKWKVRGRDSTRTYQCDPIEMVVPAPKEP